MNGTLRRLLENDFMNCFHSMYHDLINVINIPSKGWQYAIQSYICRLQRLYVICSVLWCPLRFSPKHDIQFVFTSVICVFANSDIRNTHCGVFCFLFLFCLHLMSCVSNVATFSGLSILDCPFGFLSRLLWLFLLCLI
jgi:hypothetical protein